MTTSVLITGSDGFLGRHLVKHLRRQNMEVIPMNRSNGDTCKSATWHNYQSANYVVHLAGATFVPHSWSSPARFIENNLISTVHALDYCKEKNAKLIFLSTYMYKTNDVKAVCENDKLSPANPYALSKYYGENICEFYFKNFGVASVLLRPFNVYGIGQSSQFLIPSLIKQARLSDEITVQNLKPSRDYLYVDDLSEAVSKVIQAKIDFDIFNVGTGVSYSVIEVINTLSKVIGRKLRCHSIGVERIGEIDYTRAENSHAKKELNWEPKWSLYDGLSTLWAEK